VSIEQILELFDLKEEESKAEIEPANKRSVT
jgi:hypothetical protein